MPQLFPMNWMLFSLTFFSIMVIITTIVFFFPMFLTKKNINKKPTINKMFKW
uniref:ATP synthase F0 subunit 8 n=1 Tax=Ixodes anatis TaxID=1965274 RepID=UPI00286A47B2|nr:ATP synthase F0 subunit 8 [Ixodes anatis]WKW95228.1 ATP synthase subunit 8 [Ixodes anatis]